MSLRGIFSLLKKQCLFKKWLGNIVYDQKECGSLTLLVKCFLYLANCAVTDFVNNITSSCLCWKFRKLSSCCTGTPRLGLHLNTMYRFTSIYEFNSAFPWTNITNSALLWIHHINFKNIYITINNINYIQDTFEKFFH